MDAATAPFPLPHPADDRPLRIVTGICSAIVGLTALATIPLLFFASSKPAWFLFGFEVIMPVPALLGLLYAGRRWSDPTGLGLGCVAGTVFFGSILGVVSLPQQSLGSPDGPIGQVSMLPWLAVRALAALGIAFCAVRTSIGTDRRRWRTLVWGLANSGVFLVLAAAAFKYRNSPFVTGQEESSAALRLAILGGGAVVMLITVCAGTHLVVRAFERDVKPAPSAG
ncbi:MAG: hypothetical protein AMXMBFR58_35280 [Phycisphaerae bacterium]|nr:hypothetical protein [Phycisphaerales bacterium]